MSTHKNHAQCNLCAAGYSREQCNLCGCDADSGRLTLAVKCDVEDGTKTIAYVCGTCATSAFLAWSKKLGPKLGVTISARQEKKGVRKSSRAVTARS